MSWLTLLYLLPDLLSLVLSTGVGVYCWQRRDKPGAAAYAVVALSQASWTLGYMFELASSDLAGKIFWDNVQFIGFGGSFMAFLAFSLQYTGRRLRHAGWAYSLAALPLLGIVLLAFTDPLHGLVRSHARLVLGAPFGSLLYDFTALDQIVFGYMYMVYLVSLGLLIIRFVHAHPLYRAQVGVILVGSLLPTIGGILTLTLLSDSPARDISPWTFAISNLIVAWGLFHYRLFDILPVARDAVIESMDDAVYVLDAQGRLVDLNPAARRRLGHTDAAIIGQSAAEVFAAWPDVLARYQDKAQAHTEIEVMVMGEHRSIDLHIQPLRGRHGRSNGRIVVARDITERKRVEQELRQHRDHLEDLVRARTAELMTANERLHQEIAEREHVEAQFLQAQKMEAIGRLASGVAHDFNNLLTAIIGYAELLLHDSTTAASAQPDLEQILQAANHAAALTQQLLAFSRKQVRQPKVVDLNIVVRELEPLVRRLIGADIDLVTRLRPAIGHIHADPGQLQQVVLNLVVNARDAMPRGGRLSIETDELVVDAEQARQLGRVPGSYVQLVVRDTGMGMDRAVQQHLFEPFFTTKEHGKGTGLGLATVHGIVTQSNGHIEVVSAPAQGATFTISFPRLDPAAESPPPDPARSTVQHGMETIVLVEDEVSVRKLAQRILRESGYTVLAATQAHEAIQLCAHAEAPVELLITDVVLPGGMSGRDLAERLTQRYPALRVLYISGYLDDMIARYSMGAHGTHFLPKPFTPAILTRKVREVLGDAVKP